MGGNFVNQQKENCMKNNISLIPQHFDLTLFIST